MNEDNPLEVACKLARYYADWQRKSAGARAEKVLAEYYNRKSAPRPVQYQNHNMALQEVLGAFNGKPITAQQLAVSVGHIPRATRWDAIRVLRETGQIKQLARGIYQKVLAVLMLSATLAVAQPVPPTPTPTVNLAPGLVSKPLVLAWDAPTNTFGVSGYNIHWGPVTGSLTNIVNVGTNLTVILQNPTTNQFYAATAYSLDGEESEFSNIIQPQLNTTTIMEVPLYTNNIPGGTFKFSHYILRGTNVTGSGFMKLAPPVVTTTTKWQ